MFLRVVHLQQAQDVPVRQLLEGVVPTLVDGGIREAVEQAAHLRFVRHADGAHEQGREPPRLSILFSYFRG